MSDIVKNTVNNITFHFPLKVDDFKNESILAYNVQKFKEENKQELTEYIFRHINHYALNGYQNVYLKDIPSAITKNNFVFKEWLELIQKLLDEHNRIGKIITNYRNYIERYRVEINNNMTQARIQKQQEFLKEQELKKQELIEKTNNLTPEMGLDIDQIQDEQVRVMEQIEQIDKSLEQKELKKVGINLIKEKILIKDIEILGIDNDFLENANQYELVQLIKTYLVIDEKIVKNEIKAQWDSNVNTNTIGIKGIKFKINKGVK
ncbi:hypothetical protein SKUN_0058 [Spiroplasma kunkelii CR2-3x]|uniref:Uncharacterized protein n=1 Tax=Spiroplasma kunkelii CR2-3x TaxID=273035 RepID=A0A0K2JEV9_SPIKU|nr:hypothetical protein [Spiroplasma kunkelii]ALA96983.1 hypothetical protein SKUN_0058 [Spiroplasma kunkelii CR2-3x]